MALDEPKKEDAVFDQDGLSFVVDEKTQKLTQEVNIDYKESSFNEGFVISSGGNGGACC